MSTFKNTLTIAALILLPATGSAQSAAAARPAAKPAEQAAPPTMQGPPSWTSYAVAPEVTPLKVQVVISRYQGDKKISSLPYTLSVNSNDRVASSLRMGAQVPLPTMVVPNPEPGKANVFAGAGPVQYREIGTYIDCSARTMDDGRYRLSISIEDSSVYSNDSTPSGAARADTPPAIRSFKLSNTAVLKDGQTTQFTTATDKLSGEVTRIDLTLTVVK